MPKAILITPETATIVDVNLKDLDYKTVCQTVGCQYIERVVIDDFNSLWVDEEGLLKKPKHFFKLGRITIAGKGLVLGSDEDGFLEPTMTLLEVSSLVTFEELEFLGFDVSHTEYQGISAIVQRPIFRPKKVN